MALCVGPTISEEDLKKMAKHMKHLPALADLAEMLSLVGSCVRLRILYLLAELKEVCVCDIAEILEVSIPGVSQHLAKLKAYGLVKTRRDAQTIYYSLKDHPYVESLKTLMVNHTNQD